MKRSTPSAVVFFSAVAVCLAADCARGELRVDSSILTIHESVEVAAPENGLLREVLVREGGRVGVGDPIGVLDDREHVFQADVIRQDLSVARREAQSDVRVRLADAENRVAGAELGRAESVNAELPNTVSAKEVDRLRLAVDRTKLEIEHAAFERELLAARLGRIEADLALATHRVERTRVASPIAGVVAELRRRPGEWVDAGETIARVVRVDRLRAEGYVGVTAAVGGLVGRSVTVACRLPGGDTVRAEGRVAFVSPEAEPVEAKVRFWAEVDNAELRLRPGLPVSVVVHDPPEADAVAAAPSQ